MLSLNSGKWCSSTRATHSFKRKTKEEQSLFRRAKTTERKRNITDLVEVQNLKPRTSKNMLYTFYWVLSKERFRRPVNSSKSPHHYRSPPPQLCAVTREPTPAFNEPLSGRAEASAHEWLFKMHCSVSAPLCRSYRLLCNANSQSPSEHFHNSWIQSARASPLPSERMETAAPTRRTHSNTRLLLSCRGTKRHKA